MTETAAQDATPTESYGNFGLGEEVASLELSWSAGPQTSTSSAILAAMSGPAVTPRKKPRSWTRSPRSVWCTPTCLDAGQHLARHPGAGLFGGTCPPVFP